MKLVKLKAVFCKHQDSTDRLLNGEADCSDPENFIQGPVVIDLEKITSFNAVYYDNTTAIELYGSDRIRLAINFDEFQKMMEEEDFYINEMYYK